MLLFVWLNPIELIVGNALHFPHSPNRILLHGHNVILLEKLLFCQVIFQWAADYPCAPSPLYLSDKHRTIAVNTDVYFSKSTNLYDKTTETLANKYVATPAVTV